MTKRTTISRATQARLRRRTEKRPVRTLAIARAEKIPLRRARALRAQTQKSIRVVERVVAELAHDIRTPLSGILALSELLATAELNEREREWVAALKSSAEHLAALTTLVVEAARTNASDIALRHEPFDIAALAQSAATSLRARAQGAGLGCSIDVAADLPARVIGDNVRLRAALENLIDNAVKFTERGEVGMQVTVEPRARDLRITFAVSDSGIGMTALEVKRLFRPFTQAHEGIARRFGGAGLGLSLVKRLAKAMGGDLKVTSKPGRGSTFRLSVRAKPLGEKGRRHGESDSGKAGGRALDVLYVEDNPYGRVVMNTMLTGLGHRTDFVASGQAAVKAVQRRHYDLVLMDVSQAETDGIQTVRRIRSLAEARGRVPIIAVSGQADGGREAAARAAGMDSYLVKPVSPRALAEAIAKVSSDTLLSASA